MEQLRTHLHAIQTAAALSLATAALLALPLLAADVSSTSGLSDAYFMEHIVSVFEKTGAETAGSFDNDSIETSGFDFAAFVSNTCYHPTEYDVAACKKEFGPYWNLKNVHDDGTLHTILRGVPHLAKAAALVPAPAAERQDEEKKDTGAADNGVLFLTPGEREVRERSLKLWDACQEKESTRADASRCYQRNIRRTQLWNPDVDTVY